jgi:UDP-3-O-[3-hydroxymyristoyl] glucosamine N-acyltransferase
VQQTARDIARIVGGEISGDPEQLVTGLAGIREAAPGDATFLASPKYQSAIKTTRASVLIVAADLDVSFTGTVIRVANPSEAFARLVEQVTPPPVTYEPGVHPTAVIAPSARLGKNISIQPYAVIGDRAEIGDRTVIGAGSYVGNECRVGADCLLYPQVSLRERTILGDRVILHGGVVLGADGFGFESIQGKHKKIPQVGFVAIGDDVEIGANTAIDRGRFGRTRVGHGTKIDNLVQIGHNCVIGDHCIICGLVGIAGSTIIGDHVTIAGQVGIAGHLTIGDKSIIMAQAGVTKDVPPGSVMLGAPAVPHKEFKRINAAVQRLPETLAKIHELERQLAELQSRLTETSK